MPPKKIWVLKISFMNKNLEHSDKTKECKKLKKIKFVRKI